MSNDNETPTPELHRHPLWSFFHKEHGLTLLESELDEIERQVSNSMIQDTVKLRTSAAQLLNANGQLIKQLEELTAWKESALDVMNKIRFEDVAKALVLPPGVDIGSQILPGIQKLKGHVEVLEDALGELLDEQNGPPLVRREEQWKKAVKKAQALLSAVKPTSPLILMQKALAAWKESEDTSAHDLFKKAIALRDTALALMEPAAPLFYLMENREGRKYVGNSAVWWGPDHRGYTCWLDKAGKYTAEEADKHSHHPDLVVVVPCEVADSIAHTAAEHDAVKEALKKAAVK